MTASTWGRKLDGMNAATWRTSVSNPQMRSAMTGIFLLDRSPDADLLVERMDRVTREFPALRSRVVEPVGPFGQPRLVVDPAFDLGFHLTHYALPSPGSWHQLLRHARRHSLTDLDRDRALWRATFIDGLDGGRSAVVLVVHHAIADGQGLLTMVAGLLDATPDAVLTAPLPAVPAAGRTDRSTATLVALGSAAARGGRIAVGAVRALPRAVGGLVSRPVRTIDETRGFVGSARRVGQVHRAPLSPLMTARSTTYTPRTLDVSFESMHAAAKAHGGSLNDAFLAAVAAGIRRYHEAAGVGAGPGISSPVFLGGARVERMYPLVATLGAAANITLLSYARRWCSLGIDMDDGAITDPDLFVRCLADGFAELGTEVPAHPFDPTSDPTTNQE
jgi:hypothetical protein